MDHKLPTDNGPEPITMKQLSGFGVIFGTIGTICASLNHDTTWAIIGVGATMINLANILGFFDKTGE